METEMWLASAGEGVLGGTLARARTVKASAWSGVSLGFMHPRVRATLGWVLRDDLVGLLL